MVTQLKATCRRCNSDRVGVSVKIAAEGGTYPEVHAVKVHTVISACCEICGEPVVLPQTVREKFKKVIFEGAV